MVITDAPPKPVCPLLGGKSCQATVTLPDIKYLTRLDPKMNCRSDSEKKKKNTLKSFKAGLHVS